MLNAFIYNEKYYFKNNEVVYVLFCISRSSSDYGTVCLHKRMSNVIKQGII